jgi:uncharacterized protein (TIGR04168 family)
VQFLTEWLPEFCCLLPQNLDSKSSMTHTQQSAFQQPLQPSHPSRAQDAPTPATSTIAVVGDVHDLWEAEDEVALRHLGVDLVLLVGDFGNEAVDLVRTIAQLSLPKAVILGNHDAWFSATAWGRGLRGLDYTDRVQQQLDLLGDTHVGFGKLDFPQLGLSVVGSRPFSWGGPEWKNKSFYRERYEVEGFEASTAKIVAAVAETAHDTVLFIGHTGPFGLGDQPESPCGKDWNPIGGDYGDPDFAAAIAQSRALGKHIPLVAFGHMHHQLRHTKDRLRQRIATDDLGTVYLNAASVPRINTTETGRKRTFSLVTLEAGAVTQVDQVWVNAELTVTTEALYQADAVMSVL